MEFATVVLGVALLVLIGASAWLVRDRGRAAAALAEARAELARAEARIEGLERARAEAAQQHAAAEQEVARLAADGRRLGESLGDLRATAAGVAEQLRAEKDARAEDERHREDVHREQLESVQREKNAIEIRLKEFDEKMRNAFGTLAGEALRKSSTDFLALAEKTLEAKKADAQADMERRRSVLDEQVRQIADTLRKTDEKLGTIEGERKQHFATLAEQIRGVNESQRLLRDETGKLVQALKKPEVRGRYGELQLRRVAELAGMVSYCDFSEQASQRDDQGKLQRPDMVVRLPNDRMIAVDAKTNTLAYIEAAEAPNEEMRSECLERFARHVAEQVAALGKKTYWADLKGSPDFVVMFVPGDQFLDAALARRSDLLERAAESGVILASPSTLIGLLRAVAVGWREKKVEEQAQELFKLGRQLHERMAIVMEYLRSLGGALETAVKHYNNVTGSIESRLTPTMRKFEESGVRSTKELPELPSVVVTTRNGSPAGAAPPVLPGLDGIKVE